jgi:cytochrome c nitrite reductase small subunit
MRTGKKLTLFVLCLFLGLGLIAFVLFGPPQVLAKSSMPSFCAGCHVMEAEFEAWAHTGAHRGIKCVDCHLPNQNRAVHYLWKSIDGAKDVIVFYSGTISERIVVSDHGEEVLQANCIRCHSSTVAMINTERPCWSCHRYLQHRASGAIEIL